MTAPPGPLHLALHDADLPVAFVALDGSVLAATPAFADGVRCSLDGLPGTPLGEVLLGLEAVRDLLAEVGRGVGTGIVATPAAQHDGAVFWSLVRTPAGVPSHLQVILTTAPAPPSAGAVGRTEALLGHAADATWLADSEGTVLSITARLLQDYGVTTAEIVGSSIFDWIAEVDAAAFRAAWDAVAHGPSPFEVVECRLALPGPSETWVQERLTDLRDDPDVGAVCGSVVDITARRLQEQQRTLREWRLRAGFEQSRAPQGVLSTMGRILDANAALCRLVGMSREAVLGRHVRELTHPSDTGRADEVLGRLLSGDVDAAQVERVILGPGGRPLPVLVENAVLRDADGAVDALVTHLHDLTPLRRAEWRRRQQEEYFLALTANARDLVLVTDEEGRVLYASAALQRVAGYEHHEVVGSVAFDFLHPEDEPGVRELYEEVVSGGGARSYDVRVLAADGSWRWFENTVANLSGTAVGGMVTNVRDITDRVALQTELARAQQRYRDVFEATSLGFLVITTEAEVVEVNAALCGLLGYSREELLGSDSTALMAGPPISLQQRQQRVAAHGAAGYEIEEVMRRSDGTVVPVLMTVNLIQAAGGAEGQISLVVRDQSRIQQLQARVLRSERLEAAGRVAAGVVHDTNNILGAVSGYAELLAEAVAGQAIAERHLAGIRRCIQRADDMVTQLLAFSRGQHLAAAQVDLRDVVTDLEEMLRRLLPQDVHLVVDAQPAPTVADPSQVRQVVLNLVVNARDAITQAGTVRLSTGLRELGEDPLGAGRYAVLTVADDGVGMDEATARRCFEPFFSSRPDKGGTGLGLSTAHGIAKQSGGDLRVRTVPGGGAEFELLLPAGGGTGPAAGAGRHVLVADDDGEVRAMLVQALEGNGYRVTAVEDGRAALATGIVPDLLLTDLDMPHVDGIALSAALRERQADLPVLFVSGSGSPPDVAGTRFLRKPVPVAALLAAIGAALGDGRS